MAMALVINNRKLITFEDRILWAFNIIYQKYVDRMPKNTCVYQMDDLLIYRAKGVLTPAEVKLISDNEGSAMLGGFMVKQWDELKPIIRQRIQKTIGHPVLGITIDVCIEHDELIIICRVQAD